MHRRVILLNWKRSDAPAQCTVEPPTAFTIQLLLGFSGVRHDDQVDSISQALAFISWAWISMEQRRGIADLTTIRTSKLIGPIISV